MMQKREWNQNPGQETKRQKTFADRFIDSRKGRRDDLTQSHQSYHHHYQDHSDDRRPYLDEPYPQQAPPGYPDRKFDYRRDQSSYYDTPSNQQQLRRNVHYQEHRTAAGNIHQNGQDPGLRKYSPVFESNIVPDGNNRIISTWRFKDLKNRKQTGDLYKTIVGFSNKKSHKTFCLTSSRKNEGVSTILANLVAYVCAYGAGKKTLVIDANLQAPKLNQIFNVTDRIHGLSDITSNRISIQDAIVPITSNLSILFSGSDSGSQMGISEESFAKLLAYLKQFFDLILIDTPPVLSSSDSLSIAPASDVTFLVIRSAQVQRPVAEKAKIMLENSECKFGGIILNRVNQVIPGWMYKFI